MNRDEVQSFLAAHQPLLTPIGIAPGKKSKGPTCLLYENLNGISSNVISNYKAKKVMSIIDNIEIDLFAFNEHKINFHHQDNKRCGLGNLFNGGESLTKAVEGNIKHPVAKMLGRRMEGGTGLVAYGELASLLLPDLSGMDTPALPDGRS